MFQPVEPSVQLPALETEIGRFWKEQGIYDKSLAGRRGAPQFVFYEGPPTANGMPHPGHCLTRAVKDLYPRYKTMRGYLCERKAGWDTHGLPVEVEVCKELGIHSKDEIENYKSKTGGPDGVEGFIQLCQRSVWRYMREWERLTDRLGFWIHQDEAYVTYHQSYVESVWWSLKNLFDRGLLYQGHKIVWWWAQGGTALSAGEVGQGYREVADPSVYVKFPIVVDEKAKELGFDENTSLLVWTTTPWTLPSNQFVAVQEDLDYALVVDRETGDKLIIASELVETVANRLKHELVVESTFSGASLFGKRYEPPFDCYYRDMGDKRSMSASLKREGEEYIYPDKYVAWRVVWGGFVTTDSGTGVVHIAPAFGEDDYRLLEYEQQDFRSTQPSINYDPQCLGPTVLNPVAPDGKFTDEGPEFCQGRWVKDCDRDIIRDLRERGLLYHQEQYLHDYPFCWRAEEDPLIQYPRESWFIRTTAFKDQMLENNAKINWLPEHIKDGRFGNFLETNVDWALSRERFWGTPLPIWVCEKTGRMEAVSSYDELLAKPGVAGTEVWLEAKKANPELPDDLRVHKPYIDAVTYDSPFDDSAGPKKKARMRRVPEVIDCWYDSGAMPFAQWGYRGQSDGAAAENFREQFPADFISEALDQTRGWFYSQLAISTMLFGEGSGVGGQGSGKNENPQSAIRDPQFQNSPQSAIANLQSPFPHPFRNCIVLGLMKAEWWESADGKTQYLTEEEAKAAGGKYRHKIGKMSKSLRNYRSPQEIFDTHGADALRWYFFANQPPWTEINYSEKAIRESVPEFLLRLWNVYSFFVIYANIDAFDPATELGADQGPAVGDLDADVLATAKSWRDPAERAELHRWILSELNRTCREVTERMDAYDNYNACQAIIGFVDALSNWYVRRSRDRFWSADKRSQEKLDCYWTLYECLLTTSRLIAPFVPFFAEALWQNLARAAFGSRARESVHLCGFPTGDAARVDDLLAEQMALGREISSLGRAARMNAKLKVRQPLSKVEIILVNPEHQAWLEPHRELICQELNVKQVEFTQEADHYIDYTVAPNFKRLGPRVGKNMPVVKKLLAEADGAALLHSLQNEGRIALELPGGERLELDEEDVEVRLQAKEGWAAVQGKRCVVVLDTELSEELIVEGIAREFVHVVQDRRKALECDYTDRIVIGVVTESTELRTALAAFSDYICKETLADEIQFSAVEGAEMVEITIGDQTIRVFLKVVRQIT